MHKKEKKKKNETRKKKPIPRKLTTQGYAPIPTPRKPLRRQRTRIHGNRPNKMRPIPMAPEMVVGKPRRRKPRHTLKDARD